MPWHDVHSMLTGPAVLDVAQHFVERESPPLDFHELPCTGNPAQVSSCCSTPKTHLNFHAGWNFVKHLKYRRDDRYPILAFPHKFDPSDDPPPSIAGHPHLQKFAEIGQHFHIHLRSPGPEGWSEPIGPRPGAGTTRVQVLRSSADWSHGIVTESSIQTAYIELIRESRHFVFISNQFFVSKASADDKAPVSNRVAQAIVERVLSAARSGQKFKVRRGAGSRVKRASLALSQLILTASLVDTGCYPHPCDPRLRRRLVRKQRDARHPRRAVLLDLPRRALDVRGEQRRRSSDWRSKIYDDLRNPFSLGPARS